MALFPRVGKPCPCLRFRGRGCPRIAVDIQKLPLLTPQGLKGLEGFLGRSGHRGGPLTWQPTLSHLNPSTSRLTKLQTHLEEVGELGLSEQGKELGRQRGERRQFRQQKGGEAWGRDGPGLLRKKPGWPPAEKRSPRALLSFYIPVSSSLSSATPGHRFLWGRGRQGSLCLSS